MSRSPKERTRTLSRQLGERLVALGQTLAIAESCTAGKLSVAVCAVPGASRYFEQGAVVYSNDSKVAVCGVEAAVFGVHGAISQEVAEQLAAGIRRVADTDWGVGITGIAGPDGGTEQKPVGTVHIAVAGADMIAHSKLLLGGDRAEVTDAAVIAALEMLLDGVGQP